MRTKCQMPKLTPKANPANVKRTTVPSHLSSQTPANPGNTISIEIVVIRETHWAAVAIG